MADDSKLSICTEILPRAYLRSELLRVIEYLKTHAANDIDVYFGWDCEFPEDGDYEESLRVPASEIADLVGRYTELKIYSIGESDLFLTDRDHGVEILFKHESDIHVTTPHSEIIEEFRSAWIERGWSGYWMRSLGRKAGETDWQFWGPSGAKPVLGG